VSFKAANVIYSKVIKCRGRLCKKDFIVISCVVKAGCFTLKEVGNIVFMVKLKQFGMDMGMWLRSSKEEFLIVVITLECIQATCMALTQ